MYMFTLLHYTLAKIPPKIKSTYVFLTTLMEATNTKSYDGILKNGKRCANTWKTWSLKFLSKEIYGFFALFGITSLNIGIFMTVSASKKFVIFNKISPQVSSIVGPVLIVSGVLFMVISLIIYTKHRYYICCYWQTLNETQEKDKYILSERNKSAFHKKENSDYLTEEKQLNWDELFHQSKSSLFIPGTYLEDRCDVYWTGNEIQHARVTSKMCECWLCHFKTHGQYDFNAETQVTLV